MRWNRFGSSVSGIETLAYYTVELTRPADGWSRLQELSAHARRTTEQMRREGVPVRFLRSIYVPEEETCFYLYEARSVDDVRDAAQRAALTFECVARAITQSKG